MSEGARTESSAIRLTVVCSLLVCVVAGALLAAPAIAQSGDDSIEEIDLSGAAVVPTEGNTTYLWQGESLNMSVRLANQHGNTTRNYRVCPRQVGTSERLLVESRKDCRTPTLNPGTTQTVSFSGIEWPEEALRGQQVQVTLELISTGGDGGIVAQRTVPVTVIRKGDDLDNDGLDNSQDVFVGLDDEDVDDDGLTDGAEVDADTDPNDPDSDGDGLEDGPEVNRYDTDPNDPDSDGDGLDDGFEVNTLGTNPTSRLTPAWLAIAALATIGLVIAIAVVVRRRRARRAGAATASASAERDALAERDATEEGSPGTTSAGGGDPDGSTVGGSSRRGARDRPDHGGPGSHDDRRRERPGGGSATDRRDGPAVGPEGPRDEREPAPGPAGPLTDEDRVCELLRERGGRAKQATIVAETEWSKAKVSRLLSSMDEDGRIEKVSIGRENVISLDGHGPETAQPSREE